MGLLGVNGGWTQGDICCIILGALTQSVVQENEVSLEGICRKQLTEKLIQLIRN